MKATGKILIAAVLSIFMITLAAESEARRGNYRGRGHLSRPGHFKSGHKRNFHRGHYKRSPKHRYRHGYYGHGVKHRYGYGRHHYRDKHHGHKHYYRRGHRKGLGIYLGHRSYSYYGYYGHYGLYRYGKYHPFRYPYGYGYHYKGYKTNRYYDDYSGGYPGDSYDTLTSAKNLKRLIAEETQTQVQ